MSKLFVSAAIFIFSLPAWSACPQFNGKWQCTKILRDRNYSMQVKTTQLNPTISNYEFTVGDSMTPILADGADHVLPDPAGNIIYKASCLYSTTLTISSRQPSEGISARTVYSLSGANINVETSSNKETRTQYLRCVAVRP